MAWRVIGNWQEEGHKELLSNGSAIDPGSLLIPAAGSQSHSVTVLLPDGQRILYECFADRDCARGFRVPSLYRDPDRIAVDLFGRVNCVALRDRAEGPARPERPGTAPRDEAVAAIGNDHSVVITGLAAALSNDRYWYQVRPLSKGPQPQARRSFDKNEKSIRLVLPSAGLFDVSIFDHLNTLRIDLVVAAVRQPTGATLLKSYQRVQNLLKDWNEDYQGWPVHDLQRAYLRSVLLHIPSAEGNPPGDRPPLSKGGVEVTGEPRFSPAPGLFRKDIEVSLRSDTVGATIHFTVDGSEPFPESTVYRSPIVVKGTALTIKAFARAEGKADSPVVTGIFRIGD